MKLIFRDFSKAAYKTSRQLEYPKFIQDLDGIPKKYEDFISRLGEDYPGYNDKSYMKWLSNLRDIRSTVFKPHKASYYTDHTNTWKKIYERLRLLQYKYSCKQHADNLKELESLKIFTSEEIPQFSTINSHLKKKTGFRLINVGGMIDPRAFLYGLAYGVFYSTQYIRHKSVPFYSPEPDVVHEIMGHVPMLADPYFADFSKKLGRRALGASDKAIGVLAKAYFFTIEFGVIGDKVIGAGILGSCQELELVGTGRGKTQPWDLENVLGQEITLSDYQPQYTDIKSLKNLEKIFKEVDNYLQDIDI